MTDQRQIAALIREELKQLKELTPGMSDYSSLTKKGSIEADVDSALSSTDQLLTSILRSLERLEEAMRGLDLSIDTMTSAILGRGAAGIEFQQAGRGRAARVVPPYREKYGKAED